MDVEPPAPPMWDFQNSILHGCRAPGPAGAGPPPKGGFIPTLNRIPLIIENKPPFRGAGGLIRLVMSALNRGRGAAQTGTD